MTDDLWQRVDEAIDTDPLLLRDIVAEVLARAEQAERELAQLRDMYVSAARRAADREHSQQRTEAAEAAVERVRVYVRWCAQHDVEPDVRTITAVLDGTDTYPYRDHVDQPKGTP